MKKRVAIHSVPRSGSTWLGSIFDSHPEVAYRYQPLFSYGHKDALHAKSTKKDIIAFFDAILHTNDEFVLQKHAKAQNLVPDFRKEEETHIVYKEVRYHHIIDNMFAQDDELKVIGLVRNPYAVINSWLNAPKEFRGDLGWKVEEEWRYAPKKNVQKPEEFNGFEKWKEATNLFLKLQEKYPERFFLLKYSDLLTNTIQKVSQLFEFSGLEMSKQTINFLKTKRKNGDSHAYSVYKKKAFDDTWKRNLLQEIIMNIEKDIEGTRLENF